MTRTSIFAALATLATLTGSATTSATFGAQVPDSGVWAIRTVDRPTGDPVSGTFIDFLEHGASGVTNDRGLATGYGPRGSSVHIVTRRLGYAEMDTIVAVPRAGGVVVLALERSAVELPPLTVEAERRMTSIELHRLIFDREVAVGAVGMTQAEIKAVPPMVESDVLRSLQAFAGVASVNDYSGELYVRGGNSDQVAVLIDGAPVFAPYHMFGLFGSFNADAVEPRFAGNVPDLAVDSAALELDPMVDVAALGRHLHAYLTTGNRGNLHAIHPVQNVRNGYGVVGSATYRSQRLVVSGGPP